MPAISRKTEKGVPLYTDQDTFLISGAEDLVPSLADPPYPTTINGVPHQVERFRPRTESAFARIERCRDLKTGAVSWRTISRDNVTTWFGRTAEARIADPENPTCVFQWLIEETSDDRGNVVAYEYRREDLVGIDPASVAEAHRLAGRSAVDNLYLKYIRYGNRTPGTASGRWHFHVVLDYGDHDPAEPAPDDKRPWPMRADPYSSYRAGFEIRTWRLCRRILMFHEFSAADLGPGPAQRLVRSTDLVHDADPAGIHLLAVSQSGYVWDAAGSTYRFQAQPPVEFAYTRSEPDDEVCFADPQNIENLPTGVDGGVHRWVDLDGDGVAGALTQYGGTWFYKRNLGGGRLGPQERQPDRPVVAGDRETATLIDLAGDGRRSLVLHGSLNGYQERIAGGGWGPFTPFSAAAAVDVADPAVRHVDLTGDGLTDLLFIDAERTCWHRSLGRAGYAPEQRVAHSGDEDRSPVVLWSDAAGAMLLADMSGDGLTDLARVRNGEICYWPNRGHGRFGAKVTMADAPVFDHPEAFEPGRLRLADIDGTGPTDLVYLGRERVRYWLNESGNRFGPARSLAVFPEVDHLSAVDVVDLLGTGTSCLVWSSPLPGDAAAPLRYVDLSREADPAPPSEVPPPADPGRRGSKSNLLRAVRNNLGGETRLRYAPSTKFSLADSADGTPWATRLPFPVHVVERIEHFDHVAKTRLVTTYRYRHGYYDGAEREFRGFGMVEQTDAEAFSGEHGAGLFSEDETTELHAPPVRTRTWWHTGAFLDAHAISTGYAAEYYDADPAAEPLPDSELPVGLSDRETREAARTLAGQMLRTEVYADDGTPRAAHPYQVTEHRYRVVAVQPSAADRPGVYRSHPLETVIYHYERDPTDPRVAHSITVEVDPFNTVVQTASIGYPRRIPGKPEQALRAVVWTVQQVTHSASGPDEAHRLAVPVQTRTYEVTGLADPAGGRYTYAELTEALAELAVAADAGQPGWELGYAGAPASVGHPQRRLIEHRRTAYWNDGLTAALPLGQVGARALSYEEYRLAFTPDLVTHVYGDKVDGALLGSGAHVQWDGGWWLRSGVRHYDPTAFYLPARMISPFGNESSVDYDPYNLLVVTLHSSHAPPFDVLSIRLSHDYRLLVPWEVVDPNENRTRVAFDALGRVVASWRIGKVGQADGDLPDIPGTVITYDAWSWHNGHGPSWAHTESRERHGDPDSPRQRARAWSDGSGRVAMTKTQAEPGMAWTLDANKQPVQVDTSPEVRWVGTGRTVYDNKGRPVKKYEPYFSTACVYEDEASLVEQGVTAILHYDPLDRVVRTGHPDGTLTRTLVNPWRSESWDATDTVQESRWYADRGSPDPTAEPEPADSERRAAWLAAQHAGTPTVSHMDTLGRPFLTVTDDGPATGIHSTHTELDIEGNTRAVTDDRGVVVLRQDVDIAGRVLHTFSPDAGERWVLPDAAGAPIRAWDGRGHTVRHTYDLLRRPVGTWLARPGTMKELLVRLTVHGESQSAAVMNNLRGRAYLSFDGAGLVVTLRHDFKGNTLAGRRLLARDYHDSPDWSALAGFGPDQAEKAAALLVVTEEPYTTSTEFDALNRPTHQVLPDGTVLIPRYNAAGLLDTVSARLPGDPSETAFVTGLEYDAKGQRQRIDYREGTHTQYTYDPLSYRLVRMETLRATTPGRLQDLRYTYDPVGNVVEIRDDAAPSVFFDGQVVTPSRRFRYDALHRLVAATGREHASLSAQPDHVEPLLAPLPHPNDAHALRGYTQTYQYDGVGNILDMVHQAGAGSWTRQYTYGNDTNRLLAHSRSGSPMPVTFGYDAHGNMTAMPHLMTATPDPAPLGWDHADRLSTVNLGGGGTAYYVYDDSGQRVRKVIERLGGLVEECLYLGAYERHRRLTNGASTFQRDTVHVMDDTRRVALVETLIIDAGAAVAPVPRVRYQIGDHLGSSMLEVDPAGAVISYEEYHPYGTTSLWLATGAAEVSVKRYRYTGKEKDEETGLSYHGARYYAGWLGRWTSADPSGLVDGTNRYWYTRGNPLARLDPSGRQTKVITEESEFRLINKRTGKLEVIERSHRTFVVEATSQGKGGDGSPDSDPGGTPIRLGTTVMGEEALQAELAQIREGLKSEVIPKDKTSADPANDPSSPEHKQKVMQAVNYFLLSTRAPGQTKLENALAAWKKLTLFRNEDRPRYSESLVLRDAQRYLYGAVGPFFFSNREKEGNAFELRNEKDVVNEETAEKMGDVTLSGVVSASFADPVYNVIKEFMISTGQEEEMRTNPERPTSAVGGSSWYEFGALYHYDTYEDLKQPGPAKLISPEDLEAGEARRTQHELDKTKGLVWAVTSF